MKTLKIKFYKVPKSSKLHQCSARFSDSQQFTEDELHTAKGLIELALTQKKKKL